MKSNARDDVADEREAAWAPVKLVLLPVSAPVGAAVVPDAESPVEPALGDVHASVLHACCASLAHGAPLPEGVGLSQLRIFVPPSHDVEQLDQALQPPFTCCVAHSGPLQNMVKVKRARTGSCWLDII